MTPILLYWACGLLHASHLHFIYILHVLWDRAPHHRLALLLEQQWCCHKDRACSSACHVQYND